MLSSQILGMQNWRLHSIILGLRRMAPTLRPYMAGISWTRVGAHHSRQYAWRHRQRRQWACGPWGVRWQHVLLHIGGQRSSGIWGDWDERRAIWQAHRGCSRSNLCKLLWGALYGFLQVDMWGRGVGFDSRLPRNRWIVHAYVRRSMKLENLIDDYQGERGGLRGEIRPRRTSFSQPTLVSS